MTDTLPITLFVNPVAGKGKSGKNYPLVAEALQQAGFHCDVIVSQYPGHITNTSSELAARGQQAVIACGGDGTVNELANGIAGTGTAMGIIPLGLCNNFASCMGLNNDIARACQIISEGHQKRADLIRVNDDKLILGSGFIAFETEVTAFTNAQRKEKSSILRIKKMGSLLKFFTFQPKTLELRFDGKSYFGEVLTVTFDNTPLHDEAPSMSDTPEENPAPEQGRLEVRIFESASRLRLLSRLSLARKKDGKKIKGILYHRTNAVHVQSMGPMGFYSDGDFITGTPFRLQVMPKHLNVIVPGP